MRQPACRFREKTTCCLDGSECPFLTSLELAKECEKRSSSAFDFVPAEAIQRRWNQQFISGPAEEPEEEEKTEAAPAPAEKGKVEIDAEVPIDVFL